MPVRALPPHIAASVNRLAARIAAEAGSVAAALPGSGAARISTLVVGVPDPRMLAALEAALGAVHVTPAPRKPERDELAGAVPAPRDGYDVGVALEWLHQLKDPEAGLRALRSLAPRHLLLGAPREPFARLGLGITARLLTGTPPQICWSSPNFVRLVSRVGAVRDVAHPPGWTLVWVRQA